MRRSRGQAMRVSYHPTAGFVSRTDHVVGEGHIGYALSYDKKPAGRRYEIDIPLAQRWSTFLVLC